MRYFLISGVFYYKGFSAEPFSKLITLNVMPSQNFIANAIIEDQKENQRVSVCITNIFEFKNKTDFNNYNK